MHQQAESFREREIPSKWHWWHMRSAHWFFRQGVPHFKSYSNRQVHLLWTMASIVLSQKRLRLCYICNHFWFDCASNCLFFILSFMENFRRFFFFFCIHFSHTLKLHISQALPIKNPSAPDECMPQFPIIIYGILICDSCGNIFHSLNRLNRCQL